MNYFFLVTVALIGIALGMYIARRKANDGFIAKQVEQKEVVKKFDALSQKVRELQALQSAQSADLKALKQSILHEAFVG